MSIIFICKFKIYFSTLFNCLFKAVDSNSDYTASDVRMAASNEYAKKVVGEIGPFEVPSCHLLVET
jgi:hypothetical protein